MGSASIEVYEYNLNSILCWFVQGLNKQAFPAHQERHSWDLLVLVDSIDFTKSREFGYQSIKVDQIQSNQHT